MKQSITDRLSIVLSFIGVVAFGVGVIAALIQGGFIAICFAVALLNGGLVFCFDALNPFKQLTSHKTAKLVPIKPEEKGGLQHSH